MSETRSSSWRLKFQNAFRGISRGIAGGSTNSFYIHIPAAIGVICIGYWKGLTRIELCGLMLCVALVVVSELFNSSLESLARAVTKAEDPNVRDSLDIASGADLVASMFAVVVGVILIVV